MKGSFIRWLRTILQNYGTRISDYPSAVELDWKNISPEYAHEVKVASEMAIYDLGQAGYKIYLNLEQVRIFTIKQDSKDYKTLLKITGYDGAVGMTLFHDNVILFVEPFQNVFTALWHEFRHYHGKVYGHPADLFTSGPYAA